MLVETDFAPMDGWILKEVDHYGIIDASGFQGGWDFVLTWTVRGALQSAARSAADAANPVLAAPDPGGLSVSEALEKELRLKLEVQRRAIPVIVIDHIEQRPTAD